ncbi:MAG: PAS domain S-box protein, partial [Candidatus Lokiarchaeota archaeon]|nr:PAS domain S-box protein [Candidatus Lokiarchaeota archaeon]
MKDITERQKFEVEFKNNTKLWQITLDAISESIFLIDLNHKILQCNRATLNILGKSNYKEIIGHSCWELVHGTSEPVEWCPVKRMRESGQREIAIEKVNGRWAEISATPVFDDKGDLTGTVHVITDITSRKRIEDASRESEQQYRTILNSLNDPMHVVDKDLKIIFQNPAMAKWLDKLNVDSDLIGKNIFEKFPFLDYDTIYNEYSKVFKTGETLVAREITELFNKKVFTETLKIPIKSEGKVEQVITIMRDITEQKEAEQKLKTSEEKYKNIINNLMDIIIILDLKGNFLYVSPQIYEISGFKQEEVIGKNGFKLMHPDDIQKTAKVLKEAMEQKKRIYIEYRTRHKQGHYIDVSASGKIANIDGEDRIFAVVKDISEKKISEQKLKESEEKYRYLIENSLEGVWMIDSNAETVLVNPSMTNILGYSTDDMIGKSLFSFMDDEQIKITKKHLEKRKEGISEERDAVFKDKSGNSVYLRIRATPIFDNEGNYNGSYAFLADITQKKIAEQKLKESEEKYRLITENANDMIAILNEKMEYEYVNEAAFLNIMGRTKADLIGYNSLRWAHPDDIENSINAFKEGWEKGEALIQTRFRDTQDKYHWLEVKGKLITDHKGEEKVLIISRDISERKEAEQKLKDSEEKYRYLIEN